MAEETKTEKQKKLSPAMLMDLRTSPIITEPVGRRIWMVRHQKLRCDQETAGKLLGISQQQYSRMERGQLKAVPFSMALFKAVFAGHVPFIMYGARMEEYLGPGGELFWLREWATEHSKIDEELARVENLEEFKKSLGFTSGNQEG